MNNIELDLKNPNCSVYDVMNIIGGKWKIDIIYHLGEGTLRFGKLKKSLVPITQQMLSKQLKELENDDIVKRKVYSEIPPKVEYSLTKTGKSLNPVIQSILKWSSYYSDQLEIRKKDCEKK
tara:strand:- start:148 stop:510 length:363 start_codon:yes stop_codon:yes gene_type:complete